MHTWTVRAGTLACIALPLAACGRKPQPQQPAPPPETASAETPVQTNNDDAERRVRAAEATRLREENARIKATLEQMVFFDYDRAELRADARSALDAKVRILRERPDIRLRIEGHADERGSVEYNLALGLRRAESVRSYIVNFGIEAARFEMATMGEERPLSTGSDEAAHARNRRSEFDIIAGLVVSDGG